MSHTPGPWQYDGGYIYGKDKIRPVCETLYYGGEHHAESVANSRLIAAAPEMYAALKAIAADVDLEQRAPHITHIARTALAKAKGEA